MFTSMSTSEGENSLILIQDPVLAKSYRGQVKAERDRHGRVHKDKHIHLHLRERARDTSIQNVSTNQSSKAMKNMQRKIAETSVIQM